MWQNTYVRLSGGVGPNSDQLNQRPSLLSSTQSPASPSEAIRLHAGLLQERPDRGSYEILAEALFLVEPLSAALGGGVAQPVFEERRLAVSPDLVILQRHESKTCQLLFQNTPMDGIAGSKGCLGAWHLFVG